MKRLFPWLAMVFLMGCAAQYEVVEEVVEEKGPQYTAAQVDSLVKFNRMFFWDYYKPMAQKEKFTVEGCQTALEYFWQYVEYDTARRYNDFGQAAQCYIEWSKYDASKSDSARIVFEIGAKRYPDSDYLQNALGIIYKNRGDLDKAVQYFSAASKIDPSKPEYVIPLTEIYQQKSEWQKAKDACEQLLKIDPANATIRDRLETILRDHFTPEEYIKALQTKIELEPENTDNRIKLARQYANLAKNAEAKAAVEGALAIDGKNTEALELYGEIIDNLGDFNGSIEAYKRILNIDSKRVDIILAVAAGYKNLKNYSSARTYVLKALEVSPGNGSAYLRFGEIFEASADQCSGGKQAAYSDKLVFTIAYGLFEKAANSDDYNAKENASRKMKYLEGNQILPQKSDWFMHQKDFTPTGDCYGWISEGWSEVQYIKQYMKRFSG